MKSHIKAFTLHELLMGIAIMAILSVAVLPALGEYRRWAQISSDNRTALVIADAINRYNFCCGDPDGILIDVNTTSEEVMDRLQGYVNPTAIDGENPDVYLHVTLREPLSLCMFDNTLVVTYGLGSSNI